LVISTFKGEVLEDREEKNVTGLGCFTDGSLAISRSNASIESTSGEAKIKSTDEAETSCVIANDVDGDYGLVFGYDKDTGKINSDVKIEKL
jgi:hypothetical protein